MKTLLSVLIVLTIAINVSGQDANPPIYVTLWFDTEDYILPEDDDATKRLAEMLTRLNMQSHVQDRRRKGPRARGTRPP